MRTGPTLRVAARALLRNKTRSFLTALGIIIGVAAVIAMVAIGEGAKVRVAETFESMGTNLLVVLSGSSTAGGMQGGAGSQPTLTWDDLRAIQTELPAVRAAAPVLRTGAVVQSDEQNWTTGIMGTTPEYFLIRSWAADEGRLIDPGDVDGAAKVVVLGRTVADRLFGAGAQAAGQVVRIKRIPFQVVGVLARKGQSPMGQDHDDTVTMPASTFQAKIQGGLGKFVAGAIFVSAVAPDATSVAQSQIMELLRDRHKIAAGADDDFSVRNLAEIANAQAAGMEVLGRLLASVAAVALLVGGIARFMVMMDGRLASTVPLTRTGAPRWNRDGPPSAPGIARTGWLSPRPAAPAAGDHRRPARHHRRQLRGRGRPRAGLHRRLRGPDRTDAGHLDQPGRRRLRARREQRWHQLRQSQHPGGQAPGVHQRDHAPNLPTVPALVGDRHGDQGQAAPFRQPPRRHQRHRQRLRRRQQPLDGDRHHLEQQARARRQAGHGGRRGHHRSVLPMGRDRVRGGPEGRRDQPRQPGGGDGRRRQHRPRHFQVARGLEQPTAARGHPRHRHQSTSRRVDHRPGRWRHLHRAGQRQGERQRLRPRRDGGPRGVTSNGRPVAADGTAPYSWQLGELAAGTYLLRATAFDNRGASASSQISIVVNAGPSGNIFVQEPGFDGLVSIEVEHYASKVAQGGHDWSPVTRAGASGGALQASPNTGANVNTGYLTGSPRLDFQVHFYRAGTHYIWMRALGDTTSDDSYHAGLDGQALSTCDRIGGFTTSFGWRRADLDGGQAHLDVPTAGQHTVNAWMREDGLVIDKILITTNPDYVPTGTGVAESPRTSGNLPPIRGRPGTLRPHRRRRHPGRDRLPRSRRRPGRPDLRLDPAGGTAGDPVGPRRGHHHLHAHRRRRLSLPAPGLRWPVQPRRHRTGHGQRLRAGADQPGGSEHLLRRPELHLR